MPDPSGLGVGLRQTPVGWESVSDRPQLVGSRSQTEQTPVGWESVSDRPQLVGSRSQTDPSRLKKKI